MARQRNQAGMDVQQVRWIKDRDGNVITSEESVLSRWKRYFEKFLNEENQREHRNEEPEKIRKRVDKIRKD